MNELELFCNPVSTTVVPAVPAAVKADPCPDAWRGPAMGPGRRADGRSEQDFLEQMRIVLPKLRALAKVLLSDPDEAEDLVQECLLRAWKDRAEFSPAADPGVWFHSRLRRALSAPEARAGPVFERNEAWVATLRAPEDQELAVYCNDTLRALGRLPAQSRQAIELIAAGVSYDEAARACCCCLGTFKSRLTHARDLLAELVRGPGETVVW